MRVSNSLCPVCKKEGLGNSRVEKVTSIVDREKGETRVDVSRERPYEIDKKGKIHYESIDETSSSEWQSNFGQSLSPPEKPEADLNWLALFGVASSLIFALLCGCLGSIGCLPLSTLLLLPTTYGRDLQRDLGIETQELLADIPKVLLPTVCLLGFAIVFVVFGLLIYREMDVKYRQRYEQVEKVQIPRWKKAMSCWNRLFYCYTHDIVFIQSEDTFAPRLQMKKYIYQQGRWKQ